jgi:hypothetical protein
MVEWDTPKAKGEMLEVAWAWLILPPIGWDVSDLEAAESTPGESQVISFVLFYLASFKVPCLCTSSFTTSGCGFMI